MTVAFRLKPLLSAFPDFEEYTGAYDDESVGSGAAAEVFTAELDGIEGDFAMKVYNLGFEVGRRTFEHHHQLAMRDSVEGVLSPLIVGSNELGRNMCFPQGHYFVLMPFLEGTDLSVRSIFGINIDDRVNIVCQLVDYLDALAQRRQFHGDLKEENVLVGFDGEVHLLDFDTRRPFGPIQHQGFDLAHFTPQLLAPELFVGVQEPETSSALIGPGSDMYSLGMMEILAADASRFLFEDNDIPTKARLLSWCRSWLKDPKLHEESRGAIVRQFQAFYHTDPKKAYGLATFAHACLNPLEPRRPQNVKDARKYLAERGNVSEL